MGQPTVGGGPPTDPWSRRAESPPEQPRPLARHALVVAAMGASGPVARLAVDGFRLRALMLACLAGACAFAVARRPAGLRGQVVRGALVVAVPLLTWGTAGRAPGALAAIGVLVADAAWVRARAPDGSSAPPVGLAVGPVVAANVVWFRSGAARPSLALLAVGIVLVGVARVAPGVTARVDAAILAAVRRVVDVAGWVLHLGVAVPFLYVPGGIGRLLQAARRRRSSPPGWDRRVVSEAEERRDAARPFASAPATRRAARHALGLLLVTAVVVGAWSLGGDRAPAREDRPDVLSRSRDAPPGDLPAYRDVAFADELKREQGQVAIELVEVAGSTVVDVRDLEGRFTTVRDGVRRTIEPPDCPGCPHRTIWIAGGSAAFGLGQRDEHTIASELVRLGERTGTSLTVVNLGVPAATLWQEVAKVAARLRATDERPDLVVFYDGFNDVVGTVVDSTLRGVQPDKPAMLVASDLQRVEDELLDPHRAGPPEELGRLAARKYRREREAIDRAPEFEGIPTLHVWQPDALASERQFAAVRSIYEHLQPQHRYLDVAIDAALAELGDEVLDLRDVLDDAPPVFVDIVHTNELGARLVAEAILRHLQDLGVLPEGT